MPVEAAEPHPVGVLTHRAVLDLASRLLEEQLGDGAPDERPGALRAPAAL